VSARTNAGELSRKNLVSTAICHYGSIISSVGKTLTSRPGAIMGMLSD
jgi:hypothetical protein